MGDVIDFFSRQEVPAADGSDFVTEFVENRMGDFLTSVEELNHATDEEEFKKWMVDIRDQVRAWPI